MDLKGKRCLVLGGSGAIGGATCALLVAEGAQVVIADVAAPSGDSAAVSTFLPSDALNFEASPGVLQSAAELMGGLDVLVYMIGWSAVTPSVDVSLSEFQKTMDFNLTAQFVWSQNFAKLKLETGENSEPGSIVLMGSVLGWGGVPLRAAYTASRGALVQLVRTLGAEWAPVGIRVNAVAPGWVDTPPLRSHGLDLSIYEKRSPMGRLGTPEDIAGPVAFLAGDASKWITGVTIPVDGGTSAYIGAGPPNTEVV